LTTLAVAEQLYDALTVWNKQGSLDVTSTSSAFFSNLVPNTATGTYPSTSATFKTLTAAVKTYADSFVAVVAKYTPSSGALSEQYSRSNGAQTSAVALTWSYASVLTTVVARNGLTAPSWGAKGLTVPKTCGGAMDKVQVTFNVKATTVFGRAYHEFFE
jgi:glucoamylase